MKSSGIRNESGHVRELSIMMQSGCSLSPTNSTVNACLCDLIFIKSLANVSSRGGLPETSEEKSRKKLSDSKLRE